MSTYIENYGFTKTVVKDNKRKFKNEMKWVSDYDGKHANIDLNINENGLKKNVSMTLNNDDLMELLGIQPVEIPLEQRLSMDFLGRGTSFKPITLEGALIKKRKTRKHRKKRRKSYKNKSKKN